MDTGDDSAVGGAAGEGSVAESSFVDSEKGGANKDLKEEPASKVTSQPARLLCFRSISYGVGTTNVYLLVPSPQTVCGFDGVPTLV